MTEEMDIYGVFLPGLLVWMIVAFLLSIAIRRLLSLVGFYHYVWHRPLFDIALYVILVGGVFGVARVFA